MGVYKYDLKELLDLKEPGNRQVIVTAHVDLEAMQLVIKTLGNHNKAPKYGTNISEPDVPESLRKLADHVEKTKAEIKKQTNS